MITPTRRTPGSEPLAAGAYQYALLEDGTAEILRYTGDEARPAVPGVLGGRPVSRIGNEAFACCGSLTAVTVPDGVTSIGDLAFFCCRSLTGVTLPDSAASLGANPFSVCPALKDIIVSPDHPTLTVVDGVLFSRPDRRLICFPCGLDTTDYQIPRGTAVIGCEAFMECTALNAVTIPDSVTAIGDEAFTYCRNLAAVALPDSVTAIGANPFNGCEQLTRIIVSPGHPVLAIVDGLLICKPENRLVCRPMALTEADCRIPQGIVTIGSRAFSNCSGLTAVTLPDSVTSIGDWAFYHCRELTGITLPDGVTSIGEMAFGHCLDLASVVVPGSVAAIGKNAFPCGSVLTVPPGSYAEKYCRENGLQFRCAGA